MLNQGRFRRNRKRPRWIALRPWSDNQSRLGESFPGSLHPVAKNLLASDRGPLLLDVAAAFPKVIDAPAESDPAALADWSASDCERVVGTPRAFRFFECFIQSLVLADVCHWSFLWFVVAVLGLLKFPSLRLRLGKFSGNAHVLMRAPWLRLIRF